MGLVIFTILTSILIKYTLSDIIVYARNSGQIVEEFRDQPARFGPALPSSGLRFVAVAAEPKNGCGKIKSPDHNITTVKWVALIARYNCSFDEKVRSAQEAGFHAVIVYNLNSNDLEQMSTKNGDGINIPSVFVGERTGQIIMFNYKWDEGFALIINDDLPFNINTHLIVPFSIVVGLCFIIMIGFMIVKCLRDQRRLRRHRLPSGLLKKIPTIKFGKGDTYDTCAICLDDYVEGDKLRVLPCSHAYHTKCIDPWLTKNRRVCPICKRKVFARGEPRHRRRRSSSDSMSDSDVDDRTPLINPVENSTNHGTFSGGNNDTATIENGENGEGGSQQEGPPRRINPFDRLPVVQNVPENRNGVSWENFKSFFIKIRLIAPSSTTTTTQSTPEPPELPPRTISINPSTLPSTTTTTHSTQNVQMQRSTSSNNILNKNLSGSFNQHQHDDEDEETTDDEMLTNNLQPSQQQQQQNISIVVALPNNNFNNQTQQQQSINNNNNRRSNNNNNNNNNFIV